MDDDQYRQTRFASRYTVLLGFAIIVVLTRLPSFYEPAFRDLATYAVTAHEMLHGQWLYAQVWDIKPPGIFLIYAAAEWLAGYGLTQLFLLSVVGAVITLLGIYRAGRAIGGDVGGLWAAALWTIISADILLHANRPNTELFINACLVWAFALLLETRKPLPWHTVVAVGVGFAVASMFKQVAIFAAGFLMLMHFLHRPQGCSRLCAVGDGLLVLLIGVASWAGLLYFYQYHGHGWALYETLFLFNQFYAGNLWDNLFNGLRPENLWSPDLVHLNSLLALNGVGLLIALIRRGRAWMLWLGFGLSVPIMVALPGQYVPHYYQFWMPLLCIGGGWTLAEFLRNANAHRGLRAWGGNLVGGLALIILTAQQIPSWVMSPEDISFRKFGPIFVYTEQFSHDIRDLLKSDERFYQLGWETGLYFHANRRPASGVFFEAAMYGGPLQETLTERVIQDFTHHPPPLVVAHQAVFSTTHPLHIWLTQHYLAHPGNRLRHEKIEQLEAWAVHNLQRDPPAHVISPLTPPIYLFVHPDSDLARRLGMAREPNS